jgi:hypothetical protein
MSSSSSMTKKMCIPQIESTIPIDFIKKTLMNNNIGKVFNMYEIPNKENQKYKRIIFYVKLIENTPATAIIHERFSNKKNIKVFYENPLYWKIYEYAMNPIKL